MDMIRIAIKALCLAGFVITAAVIVADLIFKGWISYFKIAIILCLAFTYESL